MLCSTLVWSGWPRWKCLLFLMSGFCGCDCNIPIRFGICQRFWGLSCLCCELVDGFLYYDARNPDVLLANSLLPVGVFLVCVRGCISGIQGVVDVIAAVTTCPGRLRKYISSLWWEAYKNLATALPIVLMLPSAVHLVEVLPADLI